MKHYEEKRNEFIEKNYITCECGYNNRKNRLENFGTCLRCGRIIDERSYFKRKLGGNLYGKKEK